MGSYTPTEEERYELMANLIARAFSGNPKTDSDLIHKVAQLLKEYRPDKSKQFALVRFLTKCGLV